MIRKFNVCRCILTGINSTTLTIVLEPRKKSVIP